MSEEQPCEELPPERLLGRREGFQSRVQKVRERTKSFLPRAGEHELSVDQLGLEDERAMLEIVRRTSPPERPFHGWHILTVADVRGLGLAAVASPQQEPPNPHHAHIALPVQDLPAGTARKKREREYAQALSLVSRFQAVAAPVTSPA